MVGEFVQCDANTSYNVVQLIVSLDFDSSQQLLYYLKKNTFIRYFTLYLIKNHDHLFISFTLGNDVSLHCIIGLPILLFSGGIIDLVKGIVLF